MGSQEQGPDQRFKQVSSTRCRTQEQWEDIACRVLLVAPEYCEYVRSYHGNHIWQNSNVRAASRTLMERMMLIGTCEVGTFTTAVRNALIRMDQREKEKIREQRNRTE